MAGKVIRKGDGIQTVKKRFKKSGTVDVGIIDAGAHKDEEGLGEQTVAEIAFLNEFGGPRNPERSFMRSTIKEKKKAVIALQKKLLVQIREGEMTIEKALGLIGKFMASAMSQKVVKLRDPPNSPATIAAKGSSNPLIDTSQMVNSITYEVNR